MNKKHIGSKFDDFLKEENLLEQAQAAAIKRVVTFQIEQEIPEEVWEAYQTLVGLGYIKYLIKE